MIIDHIGIVVTKLEPAIEHWQNLLGYRQMTEIVQNSSQMVRVCFLGKQGSTIIKLVQPTDKKSPAYQFAARGGGLHHLCFRCDEVSQEVARLASLGARVLVPPEPGEAFNNHLIAFLHLHQLGLNVELIDTETKASITHSCPS